MCKVSRALAKSLNLAREAIERNDYETLEELLLKEPKLVFGTKEYEPLIEAAKSFKPEVLTLAIKLYHPDKKSENLIPFAELGDRCEQAAQNSWMEYFTQHRTISKKVYSRYSHTLEKSRIIAKLNPPTGKSE